jgi:hypothetical protein
MRVPVPVPVHHAGAFAPMDIPHLSEELLQYSKTLIPTVHSEFQAFR